MSGIRPRTAGLYAGSPMQTAYTAWVNHGRKCAECLSAGRAEHSSCQTGKNLWAVYEAARDGTGLPAAPPD